MFRQQLALGAQRLTVVFPRNLVRALAEFSQRNTFDAQRFHCFALSANLGSALLLFQILSLPVTEPARAMAKTTQPQDLSLLSNAKHGLVHLTANDWALIADKAIRRQFKAGEAIVQLGRRTHGLYVLLKGTASVQFGQEEGSRLIGSGEVCGEISFLDELPATANVVAKEDVEAFYLDRQTLQSLFELFPHLGSRFYRSLAAILSRRLRGLIGEPAPKPKTAGEPG